jgi:hypothetical protein
VSGIYCAVVVVSGKDCRLFRWWEGRRGRCDLWSSEDAIKHGAQHSNAEQGTESREDRHNPGRHVGRRRRGGRTKIMERHDCSTVGNERKHVIVVFTISNFVIGLAFRVFNN